ncbi:MAG: carboxypeptidase regulatory-like domain-containing protein [Saprospiraceae bacterium]|jgi:hypothetical protein|nr:carboxypeptidase regulatory-like domain-containing protein [Saprospiraceae bacterium]MBX7180236.1 carboxypeptidase-like regulatory domain-containing protein [Saprospiraceae bacterium]MCB0589771.1 carboxypeptidase regulatory-like domain-containing protein [Saprospiraceae bacterium]MCO5282095.1 carboxypeptidase-like regulatory domain-containing protein [Saprospiraceae bacterium]MCO6470165.1 carboxypeptidase regulatory-like domain-containing protein [Saprospiraceae bacterium]
MKNLMTDKSIFVKSLVLVVCAAIVILLPSAASIKTVNLNGKIKYDQSTVASDAAVSLLNETDLSLVTSVITDREGNFRFAKLKPGKYFVAAGAFGNKLEVFGPYEVSGKDRNITIEELIIKRPSGTTGPIIKAKKDHAPVINRSIRIS